MSLVKKEIESNHAFKVHVQLEPCPAVHRCAANFCGLSVTLSVAYQLVSRLVDM